jgi:hypothetical protein
VPGDSGAWVVDNEHGRACGHVLAWSSKKKIAYICPMDVLLRDIGETLKAKSISFPGGSEVYTPAIEPTATATSVPAPNLALPSLAAGDMDDELTSMMKELRLPPTPSEIDGVDPTELQLHDGSVKGDPKSFVPIRLMTKNDELKTSSIPRTHQLKFMKTANMEGWAPADGSGEDIETEDRIDRADRVERPAHTV